MPALAVRRRRSDKRSSGRPGDVRCPILYASTAPGVRGATTSPRSLPEMWGPPKKVSSSRRSHDASDAAKLWEISVDATGVRYDALKV